MLCRRGKNTPNCHTGELASGRTKDQTDFPNCLRRTRRTPKRRTAKKLRLWRDLCIRQRSRQSSFEFDSALQPLHCRKRRTGRKKKRNGRLAEDQVPKSQDSCLESTPSPTPQCRLQRLAERLRKLARVCHGTAL